MQVMLGVSLRARWDATLVKNNEDTLTNDYLARKLLSENDKEFLKEIRVMKMSNLPLPNVIYGVTRSVNIVDMWKSHYNDQFNCLRKKKMSNNSIGETGASCNNCKL